MYFFYCLLLLMPVHALESQVFIDSLLDNHGFFEKESLNLEIKRIEMLADYANYNNWYWDVEAELARVNKFRDKENYTYYSDYAKHSNQSIRKLSTQLSKRFFNSGSELEVAYQKSWPILDEALYDNKGYVKDKNTTEYLDGASVKWSLPLIKNQGGVLDKKTYDLAVLDYEDEVLLLAETKEGFIEDKMMIFLDFIAYQSQLEVLSRKIKKLEQLLVAVKGSQVDSSALSALERSLEKSELERLSLLSKLEAEQGLLQSLLPSSITVQNLNYPSEFVLIKNPSQYLSQHSRVLQRIQIEDKKNRRYIHNYQQIQLPELDFSLSATRDENQGNYSTYTRGVSNRYEAKLEFNYPLTGSEANQTHLSKYRIKARQIELKYQDEFADMLAKSQRLHTLIEQGREQLLRYQHQLNLHQPFDSIDVQNKQPIRVTIDDIEALSALHEDYIVERLALDKNQVGYDALLDRLLP